MLPVESVQEPDGSWMELTAVLARALYSSTYTGMARPVAVGAGFVESPTRTTITESAWKYSTRGDGVAVLVRVAVTVADCDVVGVLLGVTVAVLLGLLLDVNDCVPDWLGVLLEDAVADAVMDAVDPELIEGLGDAVSDGVMVPVDDVVIAAVDDDDDVADVVVVAVPLAVMDGDGVPVPLPVFVGVDVDVGECVGTGVVGMLAASCAGSVTPRYTLPAAAVASTDVTRAEVSKRYSVDLVHANSTNTPLSVRPVIE